MELVNTGYCWKAHVHGEGSVLEGGPLNSKYELEQYHCHWGENDKVGAEHLVNGQSYAAEVNSLIFNQFMWLILKNNSIEHNNFPSTVDS